MSNGNITKRGTRSFRIKIELDRDPDTGQRRHHLETIRGEPGESLTEVKGRAKKRLIELQHQMNSSEYVGRSTATVESYIRKWLEAPVGLNPKTAERYRQLAAQQIYPHLGDIELQALDESDIQDWHGKLLASGGKNGRPLSARTVGHAHRVLHTALARAMVGKKKKLQHNPASLVRPPKVPKKEIVSLTADQVGGLLAKLQGHRLFAPAVVALGCGLRRGEVLGLKWQDVDLDGGFLTVKRSLGEAGAKSLPVRERVYFKEAKSEAGRRSVSLAPFVIDALRMHRKEQLETRMALGLGRLPDDALVFSTVEGEPLSPDKLSRDWANLVIARQLPKVSFHALRHSNVSMLIDGGLDVYAVSRRIGHSDASLTLRVYTHLFKSKDAEAAKAIQAALTQ
jgi:integrase